MVRVFSKTTIKIIQCIVSLKCHDIEQGTAEGCADSSDTTQVFTPAIYRDLSTNATSGCRMPKRTKSSASPWIPSGNVRRNTTSVPRFWEPHFWDHAITPKKKAMVIMVVDSCNLNVEEKAYPYASSCSCHNNSRHNLRWKHVKSRSRSASWGGPQPCCIGHSCK